MYEIIHRLLQWCRYMHIPVIMLSATLPNAKKQYLVDLPENSGLSFADNYPLITSVTWGGRVQQIDVPGRPHVQREYQIRLQPLADEYYLIAKEALAQVASEGCICVLLNTVHRAQCVYKALKDLSDDTQLLLFHARYPAETKQEIENRCVSFFGKGAGDSFAGNVLPAMMMVEIKDDSIPVSYVNAFAKPAFAHAGRSLVEDSLDKLVNEINTIDSTYEIPSKRVFFAPDYQRCPNKAKHVMTFNELISCRFI